MELWNVGNVRAGRQTFSWFHLGLCIELYPAASPIVQTDVNVGKYLGWGCHCLCESDSFPQTHVYQRGLDPCACDRVRGWCL